MTERRKKEKNFVSAVIYTRDNAVSIQKCLTEFYTFFDANFEVFELVIVNDFSQDDTVSRINNLFKPLPSQAVSLINMSSYQGVEASVTAGVDYAMGDYVIEFDTVFIDYDFNVVMQAYHKCTEGYDIVTANPNISNLSSKLFYALFNAHSKINYKLGTERFRILSRRAINRINSVSVSITYRKVIYYNSGLTSYSLNYRSIDKHLSKNIRPVFSERLGLALKSLLLFTDIVVKLAFYLALSMVLFSLIIGGYVLWAKLGNNQIVEGWTTLMLFLAISFSGIFALMAFLIKYVSLNFDLNNKNKNYIYSSFQKISGQS